MANASNHEGLHSTLKDKAYMDDVPSKDLSRSNCSSQELSEAEDKPGSPTDVKSSSAATLKRVLEPCLNGQANLAKPTKDASVNTSFPENSLRITETLSKETSSEKGSDSTGKTFMFAESSNCKSFPEETGSNGMNNLSLSKETASIGNTQFNLGNSESRSVKIASCSTSDTEMGYSLSGKLNGSNSNGILNFESFESPLNFPNFEIDVSKLTAENFKIPEFRRDCEKEVEEEKLRRFVFVRPEAASDSYATAWPGTTYTHNSPFLDFPPVPSAMRSSVEDSKPLYQSLKPSVLLGSNFNTSLSEMLLILEKWARRGLDNAFNRPVKVTSKDIGANLEKDLKYGMNVMKEMTARIYALIRAANKLPDPDTILLRKLESERSEILDDLIGTALKIWRTIDDIECQVSQDCKKLKLFCDNISEKGTEAVNNIKQEANPNILITNAYTAVAEKLQQLRKQMADFRQKIRVFCSKIDGLL